MFTVAKWNSADIFSRGLDFDDVTAAWISRYNEHNANAMCEFVNFVLKCTGCSLKVDVHDIEDPDNVPSKISDLQDEYQIEKITDYPLISKARGNSFSRASMTAFIACLIESTHATGLLYDDLALIENIQVWVTTMSSSAIRPFRHTATVLALSMANAICDLVKEINNDTALTMKQRDGEKKKKSVNKERIAVFEAKVRDGEKRREMAEGWLRDAFDTVFIHRYRDVDPRIRVDCAAALGNWITTYPDFFFEGQYLRYLGWVLSDAASQTRTEVVKQLLKLYKSKDNVVRLRAFTDRFRPRMIEMAVQDSEPTIRASAVELLDSIREMGLLEPDDVDTIGKLIFDAEPRVRKAVTGFFAENINDVFVSTVEELGGEEGMDEILGDEVDDDFENPRKTWLKFKCIAEVLQSYDSGNADGEFSRPDAADAETLVAEGSESRYSMAAQIICKGVPEARDWEVLAAYLLYDHSSSIQGNETDDPMAAFKAHCQLNEREERLLLEILNASVKARLTEAIEYEVEKKGKSTKARKDESRQIQETTALHLAQVIPRLLKKFGENPITASAVLRLEHVLNLDIFQELRQDSTEYASLLDDINRQFLTHADHNVLAEASSALLHARTFEDLGEITEGKLQELWDETVEDLRVQSNGANDSRTKDLSNTTSRIANLASISDCTEIFEFTSIGSSEKSMKRKVTDILDELVAEHAVGEDLETDLLVTNGMKAMLFYYLWKARSLRARIDAGEQIEDLPNYVPFSTTISTVMNSRSKLDDVRLTAIGTLLDLHALFATFRQVNPRPTSKSHDTDIVVDPSELVKEIPPRAQDMISTTFLAAEKLFAKKSRRTLESPADDDPPDDPDSEPEDSSDEEDDDIEDEEEQLRRNHHKQHELLVAERRLCELTGKIILAIVGRVLDASGPTKGHFRKRLLRNKTKLGANFKEVLGYLEAPKSKKAPAPSRAKAQGAAKAGENGKPGAKSKATVTEDDADGNDDDDDEGENAEDAVEEGGEEDLRRKELAEDIVDNGSDVGKERREEGEQEQEQQQEDDVMGD